MKMEMTERDKKLLIFLAVFVIVVGFGYWGIRPLVMSINDVELEKEEQEELRQINEMKLSMLPMIEKENENLEKEIIEVRENFYPMMKADEIDRRFTEMALDYGLGVYSLDIKMNDEEVEPRPYKYSAIFEEKQLHADEGYVEEEGSTTDVESIDNYAATGFTDLYEDEVEAATGIYVAEVKLKLEGERENMQRLIDDLSASDERHLLTGYSWTSGSTMERDEKGEYIAVGRTFLDLTLDIYQCEE